MSRLLSQEALTSSGPWSGAPKHVEAFTRCKGKDTCSRQRVWHVQRHRDVGGRGWRSHTGPEMHSQGTRLENAVPDHLVLP